MSALYFLIPTFLAIAVSMLVVRAGAVALVMTGMNYDKAKFQALSAFSGTGFTTREAESVVNHPLRRKIVTWLMILGNAGIVTVIVTATSSFARAQGFGLALNVLLLIIGFVVGFYVLKHTPLIVVWERFSRHYLGRLQAFENDSSAEELLHLGEGFCVVRIPIEKGDRGIGKTLKELNDEHRDLLILGVETSSGWIPSPKVSNPVSEHETLIVYGKSEHLTSLAETLHPQR